MKKNLFFKIINILNIIGSIVMIFFIIKSYIGYRDSFSDHITMGICLLICGVLNWPLISIVFSMINIKNDYAKPTTRRNEIIFYIIAACLIIVSFFMVDFLLFITGWGQISAFNGDIGLSNSLTACYFISIGVAILKLIIDLIIYATNKKSITTK